MEKVWCYLNGRLTLSGPYSYFDSPLTQKCKTWQIFISIGTNHFIFGRNQNINKSLQKSQFLDPPPPYVTQKTIDDVILNNGCHSSYKPPSPLRWVTYFLHAPYVQRTYQSIVRSVIRGHAKSMSLSVGGRGDCRKSDNHCLKWRHLLFLKILA